MLRCLGENKDALVLTNVHKGACSSHISGKTLTHKLLEMGYYWPTLMKDNFSFAKKSDQFQIHIDLHHDPIEFLQMMTSPWPFYLWGVDILGMFYVAPSQLKFLRV